MNTERWECGPHANSWGGHDSRCRKVNATPAESAADATDEASEQAVSIPCRVCKWPRGHTHQCPLGQR